MKVIQFINDCQISRGTQHDLEFKREEFYIMSDSLYDKIKIILGNNLGISIPFSEIYNPYKGQNLNNRKLLTLRHGGGGDILFMLTGLAELKRKYSDSSLNIAISPPYKSIPKNNPDIDQILSLPISLTEWNKYHYHLIFENLIENNPIAQKFNAYDLFMMQMKLDIKEVLPENKIPKLYITEQEVIQAIKKYPFFNYPNKKVGIQVEASSPIRKYPSYNFLKVIKELIERDYEVYLFGGEPQKPAIDYLVNQSGEHSHGIVGCLRQAIVIASSMDYMVAPDSLFIHIAGAFEIPTIGIYGPFPSELRMKYFKKSIGIDAKTACSPCFLHGFNPCPKGNPSPCLNLISPDIILKAFDELIK